MKVIEFLEGLCNIAIVAVVGFFMLVLSALPLAFALVIAVWIVRSCV